MPSISSSWWSFGAGTGELDEYEPHYYSLMIEANPRNKQLYNIIKNGDKKFHDLLEDFELKER